ncbi:MAG: glycosyl transferase [Nitratiruptor sp.]|nr:glycosyl transferase [Nitratiruptor sp.]NPA83146.1 glycosyltransferase family 4 protein [Campylobacterota bacterium]
MRILQLLPELNEGGVERGVVEFNRELVKRGHESYVISAGGRLVEQIEADGGVHITAPIASKNPLTAPMRAARLKEIIEEIDPQIIHARSRVPAWLAYWVKGERPFVTTVHGFYSVSPYSAIMAKGDRVICVSRPIREYVLANYRVDPERLRLVHRGVDLERFDPTRIDWGFVQEFKRRWDLENRFVIASIGRVTQLKNYELLIEAMGHIDGVLLIVGGVHPRRQDYYRRLLDLVDRLGVRDRVRFVGSQQQMAEIYALSDLVVSASKRPESFGRTLVEAMAMETPILAARHGGSLDIVPDRRWLFDPGSLTELVEGIRAIRSGPPQGLREYVARHFSLEQMVAKTLEVYKELV